MSQGRLTTHVLNTAQGIPAAMMKISLYYVNIDSRTLVKAVTTNIDGRCDSPLLEGPEFKKGTYELVFEAGDYFRRLGVKLSEPAFLDLIPIRFSLTDERAHYHVPLLVSPWSYSTYRGS